MAKGRGRSRQGDEDKPRKTHFTWPAEKPLYAFSFRTFGPSWPFIDRRGLSHPGNTRTENIVSVQGGRKLHRPRRLCLWPS